MQTGVLPVFLFEYEIQAGHTHFCANPVIIFLFTSSRIRNMINKNICSIKLEEGSRYETEK